MIAQPSKLNSLLNPTYDDTALFEAVRLWPNNINDLFTDEPWFFMEKFDLPNLEKENQNYKISESAIRWNNIKLDIYHCFVQSSFQAQIRPQESDWDYFIHFITKQNKKNLLDTNSYPSLYNGNAYWLNEDYKKLFGEEKICDIFKDTPIVIDKLLIFDIELFFDNENLAKLILYNTSYKISDRAIIWNSEKYNCWLERRKQEVANSRIEWENMKAAKEVQDEPSRDDFEVDDISENYFNAMSDGHLGNFDDFSGDMDNID